MPILTPEQEKALEEQILTWKPDLVALEKGTTPTTQQGDEGTPAAKPAEPVTPPAKEPEPKTEEVKTPEATKTEEWKPDEPGNKKETDWKTKYHRDITIKNQQHKKEIEDAVQAALKAAWVQPKDVNLEDFDEEQIWMVEKVASQVVEKAGAKTPAYELTDDDLKELDAFLEKNPQAGDSEEKIDKLIQFKKALPIASFSKLYKNRLQPDDPETPQQPARTVTAWQSMAGTEPEKKDGWDKGGDRKEYTDEEVKASFIRMSWMGQV